MWALPTTLVNWYLWLIMRNILLVIGLLGAFAASAFAQVEVEHEGVNSPTPTHTPTPTVTSAPICQPVDYHPIEPSAEALMAPYLTQFGNLNLAANEMPIPELKLRQVTDRSADWKTFPDAAVWEMVRDAKGFPRAVKLVNTKKSRDYIGAGFGAIRNVYSFTVQLPDGSFTEVISGTEYNNNGVGRKIYVSDRVTPPLQSIGCCKKITDLHADFPMVESMMAPYLTQGGNLNLSANEMPLPQLNLSQQTDRNVDWKTFPDSDVWAMAQKMMGLDSSVVVIGKKRSANYVGGWGGSIRAVYSFAVRYPNGQIQEILLGTEYNNNGVGRKIYLVGNQYVLQPAACASSGYVSEQFAW